MFKKVCQKHIQNNILFVILERFLKEFYKVLKFLKNLMKVNPKIFLKISQKFFLFFFQKVQLMKVVNFGYVCL